jgi:hypothetical protein
MSLNFSVADVESLLRKPGKGAAKFDSVAELDRMIYDLRFIREVLPEETVLSIHMIIARLQADLLCRSFQLKLKEVSNLTC